MLISSYDGRTCIHIHVPSTWLLHCCGPMTSTLRPCIKTKFMQTMHTDILVLVVSPCFEASLRQTVSQSICSLLTAPLVANHHVASCNKFKSSLIDEILLLSLYAIRGERRYRPCKDGATRMNTMAMLYGSVRHCTTSYANAVIEHNVITRSHGSVTVSYKDDQQSQLEMPYLGGLPAPKPLGRFSKTIALLITSWTPPHTQVLGSIGSKGA